jgi:ribosomal protein S18 acetylase RimI-like enzyme
MRGMTPTFSLDPFTLGDLRAVLRLETEAFPEEPYGMAEFLSLLLRGRDTFLVARVQKNVVGYIAGYSEDETGYISRRWRLTKTISVRV